MVIWWCDVYNQSRNDIFAFKVIKTIKWWTCLYYIWLICIAGRMRSISRCPPESGQPTLANEQRLIGLKHSLVECCMWRCSSSHLCNYCNTSIIYVTILLLIVAILASLHLAQDLKRLWEARRELLDFHLCCGIGSRCLVGRVVLHRLLR